MCTEFSGLIAWLVHIVVILANTWGYRTYFLVAF